VHAPRRPRSPGRKQESRGGDTKREQIRPAFSADPAAVHEGARLGPTRRLCAVLAGLQRRSPRTRWLRRAPQRLFRAARRVRPSRRSGLREARLDSCGLPGSNSFEAEVETVLHEVDGVAESAEFGVPGQRLGEEVGVALVPAPGAPIDPQSLRAACAEKLAKYKIPRYMWILDEALPRNASGKFLNRQLRDELDVARVPDPIPCAAPAGEHTVAVRRHVETHPTSPGHASHVNTRTRLRRNGPRPAAYSEALGAGCDYELLQRRCCDSS